MRGIRFLIVDDYEFSKIFFENARLYYNYKYVYANNGKKAIEEFRKSNFDIILMDIEMPVMNGLEATKIIRNEFPEPKKSVPIIAITGHSDEDFLSNLKNFGFDDYMSKMFTPESISKVVKKYVKKNNKVYSLKFKDDSNQIDEALEIELVTFFIENTPGSIEKLFSSIKNKNWGQIKEICHKLGNQLQYFGLEKAAQIADKLEDLHFDNYSNKELFELVCDIEKDVNMAIYELKKDYEI